MHHIEPCPSSKESLKWYPKDLPPVLVQGIDMDPPMGPMANNGKSVSVCTSTRNVLFGRSLVSVQPWLLGWTNVVKRDVETREIHGMSISFDQPAAGFDWIPRRREFKVIRSDIDWCKTDASWQRGECREDKQRQKQPQCCVVRLAGGRNHGNGIRIDHTKVLTVMDKCIGKGVQDMEDCVVTKTMRVAPTACGGTQDRRRAAHIIQYTPVPMF